VSQYVSVQSRGTIALPPAIRRAYHLDEPGAQVEILQEDGRLVLIPKVAVDATQCWFWTDGWQEAEREASQELAAGQYAAYETGPGFLADLP